MHLETLLGVFQQIDATLISIVSMSTDVKRVEMVIGFTLEEKPVTATLIYKSNIFTLNMLGDTKDKFISDLDKGMAVHSITSSLFNRGIKRRGQTSISDSVPYLFSTVSLERGIRNFRVEENTAVFTPKAGDITTVAVEYTVLDKGTLQTCMQLLPFGVSLTEYNITITAMVESLGDMLDLAFKRINSLSDDKTGLCLT